MQVTLKQFGDLRCRVVRASDAPPTSVVILCHGFGAPGHIRFSYPVSKKIITEGIGRINNFLEKLA